MPNVCTELRQHKGISQRMALDVMANVSYFGKNLGLDNDTLDDLLNRQSGLLGLCGVNDMREIQRMAKEGHDNAELAQDKTRLHNWCGKSSPNSSSNTRDRGI